MNKEIRDFMEEKLNSYCDSKGSNCDGCILRNCPCNFILCTDQQLEYTYKKVFPNYKIEEDIKQNENKHPYKERLKYLEEQKRKLSEEIYRLDKKQHFEEYEIHKKYVGKCYKHKSKNKYYKVLSNYSSNEFRLTCLTFNLDNDIYQYAYSKSIPDINVEINMFEIDNVFAFGSSIMSSFFDEVIEISNEDFDIAMKNIIDKFIKETNKLSSNIEKKIFNYRNKYLYEED